MTSANDNSDTIHCRVLRGNDTINLCGADVTLADVRLRDFARCYTDPQWTMRCCPACIELAPFHLL